MSAERNPGRWIYVDSIRGIAALAVIYIHIAEVAYKNRFSTYAVEHYLFYFFSEYFDLGKIAVVMFFAVSGFVIPFSLLKVNKAPLRSFAISRFFRLYPAYWGSMVLALLIIPQLRGDVFTLSQIIANGTMLQQFLGQQNILGVYWTLQIEILFYVVSAILFYVRLLHKPEAAAGAVVFFLFCAVAMGAARYGTGIKLPVAIPLGLTVMFWGLLWRHGAGEETGAHMRRLILATSLLIIFTVPVVSLLSYNVDMGFGETWYRYTIAYYAGMALFALFTTKLRITHPVCVWLGAISYSVYLLGPVAQPIVEYVLPYRQLAPYPVHVTIILTFALAVIMAYVSYRFIELPSQKLGKKLASRQPAQVVVSSA
ncbi:acyltransferase [Agrobacterium sp. MOPV5]|uniref:acyltransferase family protein n=1 Tax=Agrobacterium leguminum TaxID=2792015 RepID=UPI0018C2943D|nr:acyltransferase [Agrobacterium leguminum]MBG0509792.1 acyltransferase [Agrobacterium leguminum]